MKKNTSNADKLSENHISGINRIVNLSIVIQGKSISHYKHFRLKQSARKHHEFELILDYDVLGEAENHNLENSQKFFGKRITITFKYKDLLDESPERTFVGVITKVGYSQEKGSLGNIVLKGQSPTILLDGAPHTQSFGGMQTVNTGIIANSVFNQALNPNLYDFKVNPRNTSYINYSSQYNETHYNYISRIAEAYGEKFFYDGEILHFGNIPPFEKPFNLVYGSNVNDVNIELKAVHTQPKYFGYNSSNNEKLTSADKNIKHLGDLAQNVYKLNENIYKTKSLQPSPISGNMFKDIGDSQKGAMGSSAVEVLTITGKTTIPFYIQAV